MKKFKPINGWTRAKMKMAIAEGNRGELAFDFVLNSCRYLTSDGNKCAIGCFIPDGHKAQRHSGDVRSLLTNYENLVGFMPLSIYGLAKFQIVHDRNELMEDYDNKNLHKDLFDWIDNNVWDAIDESSQAYK